MLEKIKQLFSGAQVTSATAAAKKQPYTGKYPDVSKIKRGYYQKGDKGAEITNLQNYLNWYTDGVFFKKCGKADGIYGNNTLVYTKKMQSAFFGAKEADGLVGKKTVAKMKAYSNSFKPTPKPTPSKPKPTGIYYDFIESRTRMGQATSDENGNVRGGRAGDQTGGEVALTNYTYSSRSSSPYHWIYVFRAKDSAARLRIADACIKACQNNHIGYDQTSWDRKSLFREAQKVSWKIDKITTYCETTCSELANVCVAAAGLKSYLPTSKQANTGTLPNALQNGGEFMRVKLDANTLQPGDIVISDCHTAIIVGSLLRRGEVSKRTKDLQLFLDWYYKGKVGSADGIFGPNTEKWLRKFQVEKFGKGQDDGIVGPNTLGAIKKA